MARNNGFVKWYRSYSDNWRFAADPLSVALLLYLVCKAEWDGKSQGKLHISLRQLSESTGIPFQALRERLKRMNGEEIDIISEQRQSTLIIVKNYSKYQNLKDYRQKPNNTENNTALSLINTSTHAGGTTQRTTQGNTENNTENNTALSLINTSTHAGGTTQRTTQGTTQQENIYNNIYIIPQEEIYKEVGEEKEKENPTTATPKSEKVSLMDMSDPAFSKIQNTSIVNWKNYFERLTCILNLIKSAPVFTDWLKRENIRPEDCNKWIEDFKLDRQADYKHSDIISDLAFKNELINHLKNYMRKLQQKQTPTAIQQQAVYKPKNNTTKFL